MKFEARSAAVYRDFEKIYKLVALYSGDKNQLSQHVRHIDAMLQQNLDDPEFQEGLIQFDFLMTAVFAEGKEIFRSPSPELTMAYALFCEGVRSIIAMRGLSGNELMEWALLLRKTFDPKNKSGEDLASILWRNRFNHLRIQIYNALLNVDEIGLSVAPVDEGFEAFKLEQKRLEKTLEEESLQDPSNRKFKTNQQKASSPAELVKNIRDEFWSLPSAQKFFHATAALDEKEVEKLKNQLSDAAYSDRAKNIVRFTAEEISALRGELEAYDANHIEFNLLNQHFNLIETSENLDSATRTFLLRQIETMVKSVIGRFHAGLILFLMRKLTSLKGKPELKDFIGDIAKLIRDSLQNEENRKLILESLETSEGRKTAFEVLPYISKKEWPSLLDQLIHSKRIKGIVGFLLFMKQNDENFEQTLYSLGAERLSVLLPALREIDWDKKSAFIIRCMQTKSPSLVEAALEFLAEVEMPVDQSLGIFRRLPDRAKSFWIEAILDQGDWFKWKAFAKSLLSQNDWIKANDVTALWILRFVMVVLGVEAFEALKPWVEARTFKFWPKFKRERDLILSSLLILKSPVTKALTSELIAREARVIFQNRDLKERLRSAR